MLCEHATHDIFIDVDAEGVGELLGDAYTAEPGVAALQLNNRRDEFCRGAFRVPHRGSVNPSPLGDGDKIVG